MDNQGLIPHLFRKEFSKITTVLCKTFGLEHITVAEDIASETFVAALETWPYKGVPENPVAWLYSVAKNKTKNHLHRDHLFSEKISRGIKAATNSVGDIQIDLSDQNIADSQLQMMFALCHPVIPVDAQIGLALRILCGFGIDEIANAFLTNKEVINKRLYRAKEKLRMGKVKLEFPHEGEVHQRLGTVLTTLYLLFNEGYYSESQEEVLRKELCLEAMRLANLLVENPRTNLPPVNALLALMCFHTSRFEARKNGLGEMVLYQDQDTSLWNQGLIEKGASFLHQSAQGDKVSKYHLEATIAYWHTIKEDTTEKWENIYQLYNQLLAREYSPIAALNRAFVLSKVKGEKAAIAEAEKLGLMDNHYYHTLLGELYKGIDQLKAKQHFEKALSLAKTQADQQVIRKKMDGLG